MMGFTLKMRDFIHLLTVVASCMMTIDPAFGVTYSGQRVYIIISTFFT